VLQSRFALGHPHGLGEYDVATGCAPSGTKSGF
jgi:hypothetical protein